jgi:hypothetical protein
MARSIPLNDVFLAFFPRLGPGGKPVRFSQAQSFLFKPRCITKDAACCVELPSVDRPLRAEAVIGAGDPLERRRRGIHRIEEPEAASTLQLSF